MDKVFEVTIRITVGERLAQNIDLLEKRLEDALEFNTDEWDYDICVDSLGVNENQETWNPDANPDEATDKWDPNYGE